MTSLLVLGGITLEGADGPLSGPATQRHRLALLALLASAHPRGLLRDKLVAYLWPERGQDRGRNLLSQALHAVRSQVGNGTVVSAGDELRLESDFLSCDLIAFERAMAEEDFERAATLYRGPLLDGFFLPGAAEFERWMDAERRRLGGCYRRALEGLARAATASGDKRAAVDWWQRLAADDPYNAEVTLHLMRSMEAVGDRAGAIETARVHAVLVDGDLNAEPDPAVEELAERMRREPLPRPNGTELPTPAPPLPGEDSFAERGESSGVGAPSKAWRLAGRIAPVLASSVAVVAVAMVLLKGRSVTPTLAVPRTAAAARDTGAPSYQPEISWGDASADMSVGSDLTAPQYVRQATAENDVSGAGSQETERLLRLALRADSTNAEAWAELAIVYGWRSPYLGAPVTAWDSALAFARRALDLDPSSANAYTALAVTYGHQGLLAREERMAREALRRDPDNSLAIRRLAESYHERGDFIRALRYHQETVRLSPNDRAYRSWVGHVYVDLGDYVTAEHWYRGVLALEPGDLSALEGMAELYLGREMPDSARHYADLLVRLHPREAVALSAAASVSHYLRDVDGVRRLAGRAIEITDGDPARTPNTTLATTMLGFAELTAGDTVRAEALFDQSVEFLQERLASGTDTPRWPYELALIDAARGEKMSALDGLEQAYALGFRWVWMLEAEPMLDSVRDERRFQALVGRTRADLRGMRRSM
jgi:DNA-binding SARP family transcriptional activator/tetratricopeptide (TPR) repeat protein